MAKIKKNDFVEIEYTGRTKDDNVVFDTTSEKSAKDAGIAQATSYGPLIVCVGEGHVIKAIDNYLENADSPSQIKLDVKPEDGFGKKDIKFIRMIPTKKFTDEKITPMQGLQVNVDGMTGVVKRVGGGRVLVDFNHPLASRELQYEVKINRILEDSAEKVNSYLKIPFGPDIKTECNEGNYTITLPGEVPGEIADLFREKIKKIIPSVKDIIFAKKNK